MWIIMVNYKKIAISGVHSSGKTTSLSYVTYKIKSRENVIGILNEVARDCPYPLGVNGNFQTQWWILNNQILKEYQLQRMYDTIICDRSVFDVMVYSDVLFYNGKMSNGESFIIWKTALEWAKQNPYEAIIFLTPLKFEEDKQRTKSTEFAKEIYNSFNDVLFTNLPKETRVYVVDEPEKDNRCKKVGEIIEQLMSGK